MPACRSPHSADPLLAACLPACLATRPACSGYKVALDPARGLVWVRGDEGRVKGCAIGVQGRDACRYTLALHPASKHFLGVFGDRALSALWGGAVEFWEIPR